MHQVYFLMRIYPYWGLALAFALGQLAIYFRRRKHKLQYTFYGVIGFLVVTSLTWIAMRGDLYAETWVRVLFSQ